MSLPHIADAEVGFLVLNVSPDFCKVHGKVVPFEIHRQLSNEKDFYAHSMHARGHPVLKVSSVIRGVIGNMGKGVHSSVSLGSGNVLTVQGSSSVHVEGKCVCRHGDLVLMNGR